MRHHPILAAAALLLATTAGAARAQQSQQATAPRGVDEFARAAAQNSLSEVLLSTMALQKTNDKRVQDNAWTMLDHHSRAMGDLAEALSPGAAALPTQPSSEQQAALRRMAALSGAEFDQAYFAHQQGAHARAVSLFEGGQALPDPMVAAYARTTLPVLRAHREIVNVRAAQPPQPMPAQ